VLIGSAAFDERRDQGVAFVLDLTERKHAKAEARESERAHASSALSYPGRNTTIRVAPRRKPGSYSVRSNIKLPKVDGLEVLRQIRSDKQLKMIPVAVLTSSHEEKDMLATYQLGVNAYVVKPVDFHEFVNAKSWACSGRS
jgi:CheY-like chemotaxis protein